MHEHHVVPYHTRRGWFRAVGLSLAKPRKIIPQNQWSSDSPMDLDDELPRIQTRADGLSPVTVKVNEPCVSGWSASIGLPVPVTEKTCLGLVTFAEQAVNTPNDEERLEQMSHPKNTDGTDDPPDQVEWACLVSLPKKRRMILPIRWNGLAWFFSARKAMERSFWFSLSGFISVQVTVFPQTQRVRLVRLSL